MDVCPVLLGIVACAVAAIIMQIIWYSNHDPYDK
jgi:hypothetical protein